MKPGINPAYEVGSSRSTKDVSFKHLNANNGLAASASEKIRETSSCSESSISNNLTHSS